MLVTLLVVIALLSVLLGMVHRLLTAKFAVPMALLAVAAWWWFAVPTGDDQVIGLTLLMGLVGFYVGSALLPLLPLLPLLRHRRPEPH